MRYGVVCFLFWSPGNRMLMLSDQVISGFFGNRRLIWICVPKIKRIKDNLLQPRKSAQNWKNTKAIAFTFFQKWAKIWGILFMTDSDRKFDEDSENQEDFWRKRTVFELLLRIHQFWGFILSQQRVSGPIRPKVFFPCSRECRLSFHQVSWESDDIDFGPP